MHYNIKTKYYFINKFDTNVIDQQDKLTTIIYRNYKFKKVDELSLIKVKDFCKNKGLKFFLSNNIKLAIKLNLDGAYIPSFNKSFAHLSYTLNKKFKIIGSAHNLKEIKIKELQKVDKIILSSLFKKNKNYLGINKFKNLSNLTKKKVVVLGGVNNNNIKILNLLNKSEFAGISYFE
tara:strand:- start:1016 stop:1546 length:531 start_codon:yes stop_codon:yes gene_type:complete